ncbi:MAG: hypothetical protein ACOYJJ_02270 [Anaerovoracaceae bacterium]|jgi:hypothetical protein
MEKTGKKREGLKVAAIVLDVMMLVWFGLFFIWVWIDSDSRFLEAVIVNRLLNPFTTGAYLMGIAMMLHYAVFRGVPGRLLMSILYLYMFVFSLVGVMGVEEWKDLLIYAPHPVIVILTVIIVVRQYRKARAGERESAGGQKEIE